MLLADAGAEFAHFSAKGAEANRKRRIPSHPLRRENADIRAVTAEPDAARHEILCLLIMRHLHPDHVVAAGIADPRAIQTGLDAIQAVLIDRLYRRRHFHGCPLVNAYP